MYFPWSHLFLSSSDLVFSPFLSFSYSLISSPLLSSLRLLLLPCCLISSLLSSLQINSYSSLLLAISAGSRLLPFTVILWTDFKHSCHFQPALFLYVCVCISVFICMHDTEWVYPASVYQLQLALIFHRTHTHTNTHSGSITLCHTSTGGRKYHPHDPELKGLFYQSLTAEQTPTHTVIIASCISPNQACSAK